MTFSYTETGAVVFKTSFIYDESGDTCFQFSSQTTGWTEQGAYIFGLVTGAVTHFLAILGAGT